MISIRSKDSLGNVSYLQGTIGGAWYCTMSNGLNTSLSYAGLPKDRDETGFKILLRSCLSANDVLELCREHGWYSYEIAEGGNPDASARLIAAAPDMLEALEALYELAEYAGQDEGGFTGDNRAEYEGEIRPKIRAAIAKAKGGAA